MTNDDDQLAAVIDHAASPTQIYCPECVLEALGSERREELDPSQIGDCVICDECGRDIADDVGTPASRGGAE